MTKPQARSLARLHRADGMSVKDIAKQLGVSKSSVSLWVRDIALSDAQKAALRDKYHHYDAKIKGSQANYDKALARRIAYQEEGRTKARESDSLHLAGCMLYWAEGTKSRTTLKLVNSDADMLRFFARFLRDSLRVSDARMIVHINCYTDNGLATEDIAAFWLRKLELPFSCLRPTLTNEQPKSSQQRGRKLRYGVCSLSVYRLSVVQHVLGAIQEYIGVDKPEWLL